MGQQCGGHTIGIEKVPVEHDRPLQAGQDPPQQGENSSNIQEWHRREAYLWNQHEARVQNNPPEPFLRPRHAGVPAVAAEGVRAQWKPGYWRDDVDVEATGCRQVPQTLLHENAVPRLHGIRIQTGDRDDVDHGRISALHAGA